PHPQPLSFQERGVKEQAMAVRGIRGATTVSADDPELILEATRELLEAILEANESMTPEDVGSALFTVTEDLASTFPAQAARQMGWGLVPMMCAREIPVPGSLRKVIRVLVHWNTEMPQNEITHVYLREAVKLRPDLVAAQ
ncbi:MAG: chorismate mutase, partial [Anaerolineales bacterium]|nr:chorismate mutase [Anaerolineales bacterium]